MNPFLVATFGGVLIGLSAIVLMAALGSIAGVSGIAGSLISGGVSGRAWRMAFLLGLLAGPTILWLVFGDSGIGVPQVGLPWMALAGLLVGVGTGIGGGCTSGHGVCGVARLSRRSLLATAVFMVCGVFTVYVIRHLLGGL
ncbi:MAG: YeeE/YedE family protein [Rhodanobacter sp.]|nr:MAG: YeeE/YedE family protein [Rhodanobacter sp.]